MAAFANTLSLKRFYRVCVGVEEFGLADLFGRARNTSTTYEP